jgi:nicotinamide-nucleotide amidase
LSQKVNNSQKLVVKELKFFGIGESRLAERIQDILNQADPTVAPLVSEGECRLRMATKAVTEEDALLKLEKTEALIREQVGEFIYGFNEDTLESVLASLLIKNKQTLSVAESCTGGLLSKRLTDVPGSSAYITCNIVTYSNQSKIDLLKVKATELEKHGAVSEEVALAMALGVKGLNKSDWAIAITGIAGPDGGSEDKPVGTVFVSVVGEHFEKTIKLNLGNRPRQDIRWMASQEALNLMRKILLAEK